MKKNTLLVVGLLLSLTVFSQSYSKSFSISNENIEISIVNKIMDIQKQDIVQAYNTFPFYTQLTKVNNTYIFPSYFRLKKIDINPVMFVFNVHVTPNENNVDIEVSNIYFWTKNAPELVEFKKPDPSEARLTKWFNKWEPQIKQEMDKEIFNIFN